MTTSADSVYFTGTEASLQQENTDAAQTAAAAAAAAAHAAAQQQLAAAGQLPQAAAYAYMYDRNMAAAYPQYFYQQAQGGSAANHYAQLQQAGAEYGTEEGASGNKSEGAQMGLTGVDSFGHGMSGNDQTPGDASQASASRKSRSNAEAGPYFSATKQLCSLYSLDRTRSFTARLNPRIDRGFFLSDNDWTCYRRNYFQLSVSFTAVDASGQKIELPCLVELEGRGLRTVTEFLVGVMARTSNGSREIDLIQHTAKRDKGPQLVPHPKHCEPTDPALSYGMTRPGDADSFHTVVFERLQFKSATANNGKRRAAQQYHVVFAELLARCDDGCIARVASTESAPLVVRGRAPGHYAGIKKGDDGRSTPQGSFSGDDAQGFHGQDVAAFQAQALPIPSSQQHSAAHHMAYTAYAAPSQSAIQNQQSQSYYQSVVQQAGFYPYPYTNDPTVWANAAAAAAAAAAQQQQLQLQEVASLDSPSANDDTHDDDEDKKENDANHSLPTPHTLSPSKADQTEDEAKQIGSPLKKRARNIKSGDDEASKKKIRVRAKKPDE